MVCFVTKYKIKLLSKNKKNKEWFCRMGLKLHHCISSQMQNISIPRVLEKNRSNRAKKSNMFMYGALTEKSTFNI